MAHEHCGMRSVQIKNLTVSRQGLDVLKGIDLVAHCGDLTALVGRNGAGKTTLLRALLGEIPYEGAITFIDKDGKAIKNPAIGYVPQNIAIDKNSPVSVLDLFSSITGRRPVFLPPSFKAQDIAKRMLSMVEAEHLIDRRLGALSGGELQRVMLAFALCPTPSLLLLDEPMTGVDKNGLDVFYALVTHLLEKHHMSILMVSHDLKLVAKYAHNVAFLDQGTIRAYGSPQTVFSNQEVLDAFGRVLGGGDRC